MKYRFFTIVTLGLLLVACDNSSDSAKQENTSSERVTESLPVDAMKQMESMSAETMEEVKESASAIIESAEQAKESASAMIEATEIEVKDSASTVIESAKDTIETGTTAAVAAVQDQVEPVATASNGETIYRKTCIGCHLTGAANAPKLGDSAAWAPRIAKGKQALYDSSFNGIAGTAMVARGSCGDCSDDDLKAAVDYMVTQSQ